MSTASTSMQGKSGIQFCKFVCEREREREKEWGTIDSDPILGIGMGYADTLQGRSKPSMEGKATGTIVQPYNTTLDERVHWAWVD